MNGYRLPFCAGQSDDAQAAARLLYESDPPYYDFWLGNRAAALRLLQALWCHPEGAYSATHCQVLRDANGVRALYYAYPTIHEPDLELQSQRALRLLAGDGLDQLQQREAQLALLFPRLADPAYYLRTLCVSTAQRGAGLGAQMLRHIADEALEQGYSLLLTDVDSGNPGAVRFYLRAGFSTLVETRVPALLPYQLPASLRMAKHLNLDC